jgi:predicted RNA-binding protein with PIN domain
MTHGGSPFRYRVAVDRVQGRWFGRVVEMPGLISRAHTLRRLDAYLRDSVGQVVGLESHALRAIALEYEFRTGDPNLDRLVRAARAARHAAVAEEQRARLLTEQAVTSPGAQRLSSRDLAVMLDISHQRVHQLTAGLNRSRSRGRR